MDGPCERRLRAGSAIAATVAATLALTALGTVGAAAQGAGDDQYVDPLGGDQGPRTGGGPSGDGREPGGGGSSGGGGEPGGGEPATGGVPSDGGGAQDPGAGGEAPAPSPDPNSATPVGPGAAAGADHAAALPRTGPAATWAAVLGLALLAAGAALRLGARSGAPR